MPFFHDQDRASLRRHYVEAWSKRRDGRPMEPLEHQLAAVIEEHPEYQAQLERDPEALDRDFTPEAGHTNPFLHMGLHLAIREQVATNRPGGIAAIYAELARRIDDRHDVEHRMCECLGEALWRSQQSGLAPDEAAYLDSLRRLLAQRR
jgi:hypothetical protein